MHCLYFLFGEYFAADDILLAGWMVGGDSDDKAPDHQSQASTRPGNAQGRRERESTECILVTLPHQENIELHRVQCGNCGDIYTGALSV